MKDLFNGRCGELTVKRELHWLDEKTTAWTICLYGFMQMFSIIILLTRWWLQAGLGSPLCSYSCFFVCVCLCIGQLTWIS